MLYFCSAFERNNKVDSFWRYKVLVLSKICAVNFTFTQLMVVLVSFKDVIVIIIIEQFFCYQIVEWRNLPYMMKRERFQPKIILLRKRKAEVISLWKTEIRIIRRKFAEIVQSSQTKNIHPNSVYSTGNNENWSKIIERIHPKSKICAIIIFPQKSSEQFKLK